MRDENNKHQDSVGVMPMQPKQLGKFEDAPIEEKIQRLYLVTKELRQSLSWAHRVNSELRNKINALESHQHSLNGDCMINIRHAQINSGADTCSASPDLLV